MLRLGDQCLNVTFCTTAHFTPQPKPEPEFSRSATGFLAWLQKKAEKQGNTFEVLWCCRQSFGGQKTSKEQIIIWVTELIKVEQAEWNDEEKKSFRLLND